MRCIALFVVLFAAPIPIHADDDLPVLVAMAKRSVVYVGTDNALGSGFLVDEDMIATNAHVIEGAKKAHVRFSGGDPTPVLGILYLDWARDIAILKIRRVDASRRPMLLLDKLPKQGSEVVAIGNPEGFEFSVTKGIVSSVRSGHAVNPSFGIDHWSGTWIQTDASISGGNSGGPLVNGLGLVVGMNTQTILGLRKNAQNINFAISSLDIRTAIETAKIGQITSLPVSLRRQPVQETSDLKTPPPETRKTEWHSVRHVTRTGTPVSRFVHVRDNLWHEYLTSKGSTTINSFLETWRLGNTVELYDKDRKVSARIHDDGVLYVKFPGTGWKHSYVGGRWVK